MGRIEYSPRAGLYAVVRQHLSGGPLRQTIAPFDEHCSDACRSLMSPNFTPATSAPGSSAPSEYSEDEDEHFWTTNGSEGLPLYHPVGASPSNKQQDKSLLAQVRDMLNLDFYFSGMIEDGSAGRVCGVCMFR